MLALNDIHIIETAEDCSEMEYFQAVQRAINDGTAWKFQGSYGRSLMEAIEAGFCMLGKQPARDYWGNRIPSRDEVKQGTKGSYDFVVEHAGQDWADELAAL